MSHKSSLVELIAVINGTASDTFASSGSAITEARQRSAKRYHDEAVERLATVFDRMEKEGRERRDAYRRANRLVQAAKSSVGELKTALAYFEETNNVLPLMHVLGLDANSFIEACGQSPDDFSEEDHKVQKGWQPTPTAEAV